MTYKTLLELVATLAKFAIGGEAHHAFRQSIINELEMYVGYSAVCAEQVVDVLERDERKKAK